MTAIQFSQMQSLAPQMASEYRDAFKAANVNKILSKYGISKSPLRVAHFFAQVFSETGGLSVLRESLNYSATRLTQVWPKRFPTIEIAHEYAHNEEKLGNFVYGGRMGNVNPGDGFLFRGRGLLQITGRDAYTRFGKQLGIALPDHPDLAFDPANCLEVAAAEWAVSGDRKGRTCNELADLDDVVNVTYAINGGQTGIADRILWLKRCKTIWVPSEVAVAPPVASSRALANVDATGVRGDDDQVPTLATAVAPAAATVLAFDSKVAAACGRFVQAAYSMYNSDPSNLTPPPSSDFPPGYQLVGWVQMQDFLIESTGPIFYGFVAQSTTDLNRFVVALRGTENGFEWWDNFNSAFMTPFKIAGCGSVGAGFSRIYDTLEIIERRPATAPAARTLASAGGFSRQVAGLVSRCFGNQQSERTAFAPTATVDVTGHSLGGALATLYVMENALTEQITNPLLCTFASPAVGNSTFVTTFNGLRLTSWRIFNMPDLVPKLPPALLGFAHVDAGQRVDSTGTVNSSPTCWHALSTYLSLIDPMTLPDPTCRRPVVSAGPAGVRARSAARAAGSAFVKSTSSFGGTHMSKPYVIDLYHDDNVQDTPGPLGGFARVKASGIAFLIHKATEGTSDIDPRYVARRTAWMSGGSIPVIDVDGTRLQLMPRFAAYHFFHGQDPVAEAQHFLQVADLRPGDDAVVDWERVGGAGGYDPSANAVDQFCNIVEQKLGFPIIVYSGDVAKQQLVGKDARFAKRRLWLAEYGNSWRVQGSWSYPWLWQNNGDKYGPGPNSIDGIDGYCDNSTVAVPHMTVAKLYADWGGGKEPAPAALAAAAVSHAAVAPGPAAVVLMPTIQIAVLNESSAITDADVQKMIPAFEQQWNRDLGPIWGVNPATFTFVPKGQAPASGTWWVVFLNDSDQADALAYHDLTNEGLPISKVFVKTLLDDKANIGVGATHEICEMAVDPWLNSASQDPQGVFWAGEICDPVEDDQYGYQIGDTLVTDFVTPNWFGHKFARGPFDFKGHSRASFEVLSGGYAQKFDCSAGWEQVTGSMASNSIRASAPKGSRRNRRMRQWKTWERSNAVWTYRA